MLSWNKDFQDFLKSQFRNWGNIVQGDKPTHYKLEFNKTDSEIIFDIATKKINTSLPKLEKVPRNREVNNSNKHEISAVITGWLFTQKGFRELDEQIFNLDATVTKGYNSMNIAHYFGLNKEFKGIFQNLETPEVIKILEEDPQDFNHIVSYLKDMAHTRDVLVPDSYVYPHNKKGKGAGESKLYIGNQNNDTYQFWGNLNDVVEIEIDKKSLLKYYFDIENEFKFPTQDYRDQNKIISSFKELFIDINNLENEILMKFTLFSGPKDAERVYLKTTDERSKMINTLIRKVSLHPFTNLRFIKIMKNKYVLNLNHIKKIENEIEDSVTPINIEGFVNTHKSEYDTHVTDKKLRDLVLSIHNYKCQFCKNKYEYINTSLERVGYGEGAHIKAKNPKIGGEDKLDNLLCLCPTCHKLFDLGALWMDDELTVRDIDGGIVYQLTEIDEHPINIENIKFHRNHFKERRN